MSLDKVLQRNHYTQCYCARKKEDGSFPLHAVAKLSGQRGSNYSNENFIATLIRQKLCFSYEKKTNYEGYGAR